MLRRLLEVDCPVAAEAALAKPSAEERPHPIVRTLTGERVLAAALVANVKGTGNKVVGVTKTRWRLANHLGLTVIGMDVGKRIRV